MSALSDALTASQGRAVAALGKAYVGGHIDAEDAAERLTAMGLSDPTDTAQLFAAWNVLRDFGAAAPAEQAPRERPAETATQAQRDRIKRDLAGVGHPQPDLVAGEPSLTKAQASELIASIAKGTYDAAKWEIPF